MSKTNIATRTLDSKNDSERSVSTDRVPLRVVQHHALRVVNLHKSYRKRNVAVPVLKGVNLEIEEGKFTAIVGQSGSEKARCCICSEPSTRQTTGEVWYNNNRIDNLPVRQQEQLRNRDFGMIFQFYHLLQS